MATVETLKFGPFTVHPTQGLRRDGEDIHVTPRSLAVLCALARHPSEVVTKTELFDTVWTGRVVTDSALSSCIRELREALDDDARRPQFIETVHGRGFRLRVACTVVAPASAGGPWLARQPSLVVLPFETLGGDDAVGVLARGLTHDVTTLVARARTTLVIARGTSFSLEHADLDIGQICDRLGVRYVVQGALAVQGRRLSLSVALADGRGGHELWAERYERPLDDWMLLQRELAELIVASVEMEVQREEIRSATLKPSENLDAWSAYHRGLGLMYRFREQDCDAAEHWFRRSVALEPEMPRPWAGLSFLDFQRAFLLFDVDRPARIRRALDHARQAIQLDPRDPMGHWALSRAELMRGELEASKQAVDLAISLNPSYAIAQYSRGWVGMQLGENASCDEHIGFARRLSPYDPLKFAMLGVTGLNRALTGRTEDAIDLARRSVRPDNAHYLQVGYSAVTLALCDELEEAGRYLSRIRKVAPDWDAKDFLAVFRSRRQEDERRISRAFDAMRGHAA